ncbi:GTPase HflX [Sediminispirochaeta bajacaliforniensis]|uniref:GTPase HflX n=1 Tax=Sediminispirochaeta bajacaliforniensis TaxID=148 RepID=UPI00037CC18E|nr:GTPase HflX [Sediminispirochaeta bajacaliforniensis]
MIETYQSETEDSLPRERRAFLVELRRAEESEKSCEAHLAELKGLVKTLGLTIAGTTVAPLRAPSPALLLGSGKSEEIADSADELDAGVIIIDDDLTPRQQRNWEQLSGCVVIDRQEVILEIFADRAATREASLQVALARMEYSLPRLTRAWTHLSRQRGGSRGTRGEGETQLESDRRIVLAKVAKLKKELEGVRKQRATARKQRRSVPLPTVALVGYTNAGKSSLLNALAGSTVNAEDKLFATLDPTTRRLELSGGRSVLLTDTVGFIRKLPHALVDAFRATLEETLLADLLIHVIDASDPEAAEHYRTTRQVLSEIGAEDTDQIIVLNKADLPHDQLLLAPLREADPQALFISTKSGLHLDALKERIAAMLEKHTLGHRYRIPLDRYDLVALLHREGRIIKEEAIGQAVYVEAIVNEKIDSILKAFRE